MFIDTYMINKQAKIENISLYGAHLDIIAEIDERQGLREPLELKCKPISYMRSLIWRLIQENQPNVIVVDSVKPYAPSYRCILAERLAKQQFEYRTFIFNYKTGGVTYQWPELYRLREEVEAGNKMVIFAGNGD